MNSEGKGFFADQNLTTIKITLSLIGLATSLIFLQNYNDLAFSQIVPNTDNLTTPGLPALNESLAELQEPSGFVTNGKINTVIDVPNGKWLATGNWSIIMNNGNVTKFETKMTWYNSSGTNAHTHELTNFRAAAGDIQTLPMSGPANQIVIKGVTDVGSNSRVSWLEVPTIITINDRKILSISLDDNKTTHHFGGQPLLGIVDSFVPCSDLPGPNMEILPSCSVSPVGEQGFALTNDNLTNDTSAFTPSEDSLTYGGTLPGGGIPGGGIPGGGIPGGGIPGGGIPPGDEQTGGGGIPGGGIPPGDEQTGGIGIPPGGIPGGGIPPGDEQTGGGGIPPGDEQTGGGGIPPGDEQTGGGGIPPGDEQTGGGGIPPGDEQTGGGGIPPLDNQTSGATDNQTSGGGIPPGGIPPGGIPPGGIPPMDNQTDGFVDNQTGAPVTNQTRQEP